VNPPRLMGIVNATPDSFSDPQVPKELSELVEQAREQLAAGAALIDVGGESGRTDTEAVPVEEEIARVVPLVERLSGEGVTVSLDTWRAPVARAALDAGAAMINDVSGLSDPKVADACATAGAALVITHTRLPPKTKGFPAYADVVEDVRTFLQERAEEARARGVADEQLVFDPGIDLAKTPAESVEVLRRLPEVGELGRPLLVGVSRKDFLGALTGRPPSDRRAGTLAAVGAAVDGGAAILRVHDVADARDYLAVRAALRGETAVGEELRLDPGLRRETV
jgi:dihydropteroate synthase